MGVILGMSINRRNFMKAGLAAAGGIFCLGKQTVFGSQNAAKKVTRLVFLSDTHIPADVENTYRGFFPYQNLQKVVPDIVSARPDGVVITGDLARLTGEPGDYENLKNLLNPIVETTNITLALGNHDNRENFLKVFDKNPDNKRPVRGKHVVVVDTGPVRLIILDSMLYVNKGQGLLGKAQRQWLENYLNNCDDKPAILCFHHTLGDGDGDLLDVPRLFNMIKSIRKVKAIIYGHSHVYDFAKFKGIHLINIPAMGYNFSDSEPVGWIEARLTANGGDFTLRTAGGNEEEDGSIKKLIWRKEHEDEI